MIQDREDNPQVGEMLSQIKEAQKQSLPYEFLNEADNEEMTVNISVAPSTSMKDVSVKLTKTSIRVEVKGHEVQPCVIDGCFFREVDIDGCDHHIEGSGDGRMLVIDLLKVQNGFKWPELLGFGNI